MILLLVTPFVLAVAACAAEPATAAPHHPEAVKRNNAFALDLYTQLRQQGGNLFSRPKAADFSGIDGKRDLFVSAAIHKAYVAVDEEGTEAAAVTALGVFTSTMVLPRIFRADHPFIFPIRDNRSGSILFMGRVTDPSR